MKGIFTSAATHDYEKLKSSSSPFVPVNLNCESKFVNKAPYGITFTQYCEAIIWNILGNRSKHVFRFTAESSFTHVEDFESSSLNPQPHTLGACILPPPTAADDTTLLLQTILLNSHYGLTNFLLYDSGLTHKYASRQITRKP